LSAHALFRCLIGACAKTSASAPLSRWRSFRTGSESIRLFKLGRSCINTHARFGAARSRLNGKKAETRAIAPFRTTTPTSLAFIEMEIMKNNACTAIIGMLV
jgi:hypothetical protein